ncbi:preprotein translocase subunit SecY, partial [Rhodococcus jostii]
MLESFVSALRTPDLRAKILIALGLVALYRIGAVIPSPGVDYGNVRACV